MSRYLALDMGQVRIGVAITDDKNLLSLPLEVIDRTKVKAIYRIKDLVREYKITDIVIGLPLKKDGTSEIQVEKIKNFTNKLLEKIKDINIHYFDERYTTKLAHTHLREMNKNAKKSRQSVDMIAASIILEDYLKTRRDI